MRGKREREVKGEGEKEGKGSEVGRFAQDDCRRHFVQDDWSFRSCLNVCFHNPTQFPIPPHLS